MGAMSVATIDNPEFINLEPVDINPFMSKCEIKVLYVGQNRNQSYITKEVAAEMAKTLRGAPIVGYYKEDKGDFTDHGDKITIDSDGIKFESLTKPYGFVSPDAEVWFQNFDDTDEFGNVVTREYLMTTGYLWTGQYEEADLGIDGRPQSMELDGETLDGHWAEDTNQGMEFFIIDDAIFSKLCILGEDVEPCFEGASISAPEVSTSFTLDRDFTHTLYSMMQQLNDVLGGSQMAIEEEEVEEQAVVEPEVETPVEDFELKYTALQQDYTELQTKFDNLENDYNALIEFKNGVELEKKQALIDSFTMLTDEDKQDVVEHIADYSLDDIEAKLSVICVRKKVSFTTEEDEPEVAEPEPVSTFDVHSEKNDTIPAWIAALRKTKSEED